MPTTKTTFETLVERAAELADVPKYYLRMDYPYVGGGSRSECLAATKGLSRGAIIKEILEYEFSEDAFHNESCYSERP